MFVNRPAPAAPLFTRTGFIMAAKRRPAKRKARKDPIQQIANTLGDPKVVGVLLVLVAVFTLLSLVTDSRGELTGAWIDLLRTTVGSGVWGMPLILGLLGLWMVIRAVEKMPDLPWQRPLGLMLIFLAYLTGAGLIYDPATRRNLAEAGQAGGWLGLQLSNGFADLIGQAGAWIVALITLGIGLFLLTDQLLIKGFNHLVFLWDDWRFQRGQGRDRQLPPGSPIQPAFPLATGELPWWKQLLERIRPKPEPPIMGRTTTPRSERQPSAPNRVEAVPTRGMTSAPAVSPPRQTTTQPSDGASLTPRIVGGHQAWRLPSIDDMLVDRERLADSDDHIRQQGRLIQETLALFGVPADFEGAYKGPAVTQYLIKPGYVERTIRGETKRIKVKVSKIAALTNDLALALAAPNVRIEAPIPGTNYVGIEVPNREGNIVGLKELMQSDVFTESKAKLPIALGEDVKGQPIVADLTRMPHLLIAGATGAGKSVCINSIICDLLITNTPDNLRLLMIDPKMVELNMYNGIPHLLSPVVTEIDKASGVLFWAVKEMERRYQLFSKAGTRDLERYNAYLTKRNEPPLPYIVIIVDEMADLMMASPEEVEKHICRLAQMARAVGMHLIIATQRPSVDVITGLIKANFPSRIAFAVTSQIDSRVILDVPGADRLLGRGDMLFMAPDASKLERLQGTFLGDDEINRIVRYWKGVRMLERDPQGAVGLDGLDLNADPPWEREDDFATAHALGGDGAGDNPFLETPAPSAGATRSAFGSGSASGAMAQPSLFKQIEELRSIDNRDELFLEAVKAVIEAGRGSVSLLQRKLRVGYSRASRLVDQLEEAGVLGPDQGGSQGRVVLINDLADLGNGPQIRSRAGPPPPAETDTRSTPSPAPLPPPRIIGDEEQRPSAKPKVWW